jgi:GntR family transcriptional regulator
MPRRTDTRPFHEQVAARLRADIMAGDYPPGAQLPSTPQLVERFGVANPTIQKALRALKEEGFLFSRPGKGVYVRDKQPFIVEVGSYFAPSPGGYSYELLDVAEVTPPNEVAMALQLGEDRQTVLRRRILRHDGEPVELDWSFYPLEIVGASALTQPGRIRGGAPKVLEELGYPEREFVDRVSTRMPTPEEIELLDLPDVPVIRQLRIVYSDDQRPVTASVFIKGGHLYELLYRQTTS